MSITPFAITSTSQKLELSAQKQGNMVFTVFNASGRAILPARAEIVADQPAAQTWLKLEGSAEKNFAEGGTQQYTVTVQVPDTAAAGKYTFRLNMVGVENPDEDFTEGSSISFSIPEKPAISAQKPKIPWLWIILGTLGFIAIAAILICQMAGCFTKTEPKPEPQKISLKSHIGKPLGILESELKDSGFVVTIKQQSNKDYRKDIVFDQDPDAGSYDVGTPVKLFVSNDAKLILLENVQGLEKSAAEAKLKTQGFAVQLKYAFDATEPKGNVISQQPAADAYYPEATSVTLVISSGEQPNPFVGTWTNKDTNTRGMTRLEIEQTSNKNEFTLHGFGSCSPQDCDWKKTKGTLIGDQIRGEWVFDFKTTQIDISLSNNQLTVNTHDRYNDSRPERIDHYTFVKKLILIPRFDTHSILQPLSDRVKLIKQPEE